MNKPLVSVLFVTYDRVHLLKRTLESFIDNTRYPNLELVVTDDGSPREIQQQIQLLPFHKYVMNPKREGLGANTNRGLRQCAGDYVLALQDDWECRGPVSYLEESVRLMQNDSSIGLVRFYGITEGDGYRSQQDGGRPFVLLPRREDDEYHVRPLYSDTPHLKSRALMELLGPYSEGVRMEDCELKFESRFRKQDRFAVAYFPDLMNTVFVHTGEDESFRTRSLRHRFEARAARLMTPLRGSRIHTWSKQVYRGVWTVLRRFRLEK